ncbi:MAG: UDP-N-acetylmuramate dehydrogenase [Vulcanibacillus sp.]
MKVLKDWKNLLNINNIIFKENELLSKYTSWGIGGPAKVFILPRNKKELINTLEILRKGSIKWKVIGNGSNILAPDEGYDGAIISLRNGFNQYSVKNTLVTAGAGFSLIHLANIAAKHGLSGLEFAAGIPGTVGGAVSINAGAHGSDISKILQEAEVLLENGEVERWTVVDFKFDYRSSILHKEKAIVIDSIFKLETGNTEKIISDMVNNKERRIKTQPFNLPSAGSVFRNPNNDYSGRLIEELGLKGYRIGDAQISTIHSNFIVNIGNATSKDILALINYIKEKVYEKYNIELITEVELIGDEK